MPASDIRDAAQRAAGPTPTPALRVGAIDILRGVAILLMALDHVRSFFMAGSVDPLNIQTTSVALYTTRWITDFCAPAFILLAGVSAHLFQQKAQDLAALSRFLLSRGVWLVLLEVTVVSFAWHFSFHHPGLGVIWAIGLSMVALAGLVWLPKRGLWVIALLMLAGQDALTALPAPSSAIAPAWTALLTSGGFQIGGWHVYATYAALPWLKILILGYLLGPMLVARDRRPQTQWTGLAMIAGFILLRLVNGYGDPDPWIRGRSLIATLGSFLDTEKYPPSLIFSLMTLGPILVVLPWLYDCRGRIADMLRVYGRAPLLFYVAHLFLAHAIMLAVGMARGMDASLFVSFIADPSRLEAAGWGFGLPTVYGVWFVVIAALYPACRWFGQLKARRTDWWLSYL